MHVLASRTAHIALHAGPASARRCAPSVHRPHRAQPRKERTAQRKSRTLVSDPAPPVHIIPGRSRYKRRSLMPERWRAASWVGAPFAALYVIAAEILAVDRDPRLLSATSIGSAESRLRP